MKIVMTFILFALLLSTTLVGCAKESATIDDKKTQGTTAPVDNVTNEAVQGLVDENEEIDLGEMI